ncbi:hypothetical protein P8X24_10870 [Pyrococcus kukulkanii]|uniref:hypothetical protein n=1 Tax=Pyrococcus kukulkanii TaxID=1609559 RepID=UPI0035658DC0
MRLKIPKTLLKWLIILYIFVWFIAMINTDGFRNTSIPEVLFRVHFIFLIFAGLIIVAYLLTPVD